MCGESFQTRPQERCQGSELPCNLLFRRKSHSFILEFMGSQSAVGKGHSVNLQWQYCGMLLLQYCIAY